MGIPYVLETDARFSPSPFVFFNSYSITALFLFYFYFLSPSQSLLNSRRTSTGARSRLLGWVRLYRTCQESLRVSTTRHRASEWAPYFWGAEQVTEGTRNGVGERRKAKQQGKTDAQMLFLSPR